MTRVMGASIGVLGLVLAGGVVTAKAGDVERHRIVHVGHRARLGVSLADVTKEDVARLKLREEQGARVLEVNDDTPAAAAGLKEDDVILRYEGEAVHSASQLARLVRETPAGRKVTLEISRDGAPQSLSATLGEQDGPALGDLDLPAMPSLPDIADLPAFQWNDDDREKLADDVRDQVRRVYRSRGPRLGIRFQELSDQLARYFKVEDGLLVSSVDEDSPAAKAGVQAGDVIVKFNGKSVGDAGDLGKEVAQLESGQEATITVQRDGRPLDLKVTLAGTRSRRVPRSPST